MTRMFEAELLKLRRRRVAVAVVIGALAFAAIASAAVFLSATDGGSRSQRGATVESLGQAGGATEAFSIGASFVGILVLVLVIANVAGEFTQGTFRTLLMRQPRRVALLAGKMAALLAFAAIVLAIAELVTVAASTALAVGGGEVSTASWFGIDGLAAAAGDYVTALLGVAAWASFGMALAVLVRSTPVALGIGIVWSGPFEHILQAAWTAAGQWFPGLLLEALAAGATTDASSTRALALVGLYVIAAVSAAAIVFARRDVTA